MLEKTWRVIYDKRLRKFQVTLQWKGKTNHVGYYTNLCDAIITRNVYLRKLYGSLAEAWTFLKPRRFGAKRTGKGKSKFDELIDAADTPIPSTPTSVDHELLEQFKRLQKDSHVRIDDLPLG
jgi:hypothetical protein